MISRYNRQGRIIILISCGTQFVKMLCNQPTLIIVSAIWTEALCEVRQHQFSSQVTCSLRALRITGQQKLMGSLQGLYMSVVCIAGAKLSEAD
ncbi:MAG: hypothetical protein HC767_11800 [Akkermansiaceae bacterium]|nr:hypothetical protein [Akkermansiaceae bacterium]